MKVIIAGSRSVNNYDHIERAIELSQFKISQVISGTARGVDQLGEKWADLHNIPVKRFPADWGEYGKSAGYKRNEEMADYADAVIAIWDGISKGTNHMINIAERKNLKVFVHYIV